MNQKKTSLITAAIVMGLIGAQQAHADQHQTADSKDMPVTEKNSCKGHKADDKNGCGGKMQKKKEDKNSCKNGCGEAKK